MNLNTIFFIGPQGSGKGTQAKILADTLGFFHWDNGAICREAAKNDNEIGHKVKELMEQGLYLPDDLLLQVAQQKLESIPPSQGVVFDGIPRRLSQAEFIMNFLRKQGREHFATIFLDLPKEESIARIMLRAEQQKRADDNREAIERRLQQYYDETMPILDFMKQHGEFIEIDGRPTVDEVSKDIQTKLGVTA
jgi:adenylate kinase